METKCKECNGTGWLIVEKDAEPFYGEPARGTILEFAQRCPACNGGQAIVEQTKKRAQLPASFYNAELKDFDWTIYRDDNDRQVDLAKQQQFVEAFVNEFKAWQEFGLGLYIWSHTRGSGKTFLASAICNTLIKKYGVKPKFVSAFDLINLDKSASTDKYATRYEKDPIAELCECDLLVLDDLGKQNGDNWTRDIMYRITNSRMTEKRITIITSNARNSELPFDDKLTDRINKLTQNIPLPDYCVRAREANEEKRELYTKIGLINTKPTTPEQMSFTR